MSSWWLDSFVGWLSFEKFWVGSRRWSEDWFGVFLLGSVPDFSGEEREFMLVSLSSPVDIFKF